MTQIPRTVLVPAAILAGVCPLVANSLYEDSVGDGEQVLAQAAASPAAEKISVALFMLGFAALVVVLAILSAAVAGSPPWAGRRSRSRRGRCRRCPRRRRSRPTAW